jgi:hypothetical protein
MVSSLWSPLPSSTTHDRSGADIRKCHMHRDAALQNWTNSALENGTLPSIASATHNGTPWEADEFWSLAPSTNLRPWKCSWWHLGRDRVTFWSKVGIELFNFVATRQISGVPRVRLNNFAYLHDLPGLICRTVRFTPILASVVSHLRRSTHNRPGSNK